jgi:ATPase family associated with various cellular activities (AAA)
MEPIRVILCRSKIEIGIEGVEAILREHPSIDLHAVVHTHELEDVFRTKSFTVLVLQAGEHSDSDYQNYLDLRPEIRILVIDLAGPDTIVRFRDVGGRLLANIIKALSDESRAPGAPTRIHWLKNEDVDRLAVRGEAAGSDEPSSFACAHLGDVKRWLRTSLSELLPPDDAEATPPAFAGWTMNAAQARALCGPILDKPAKELWNHIEQSKATARADGVTLPMLRIAEAFGFDEDGREERLLWHALAPELDGGLACIHGYLNNDLTRRRPTLTRLAQLIDPPLDAWSLREFLAGSRPFARHRLISVPADHPHGIPATEDAVAPAPEIVRFLLDGGSGVESGAVGVALLSVDAPGGQNQQIDPQARDLVDDLRACIAGLRRPVFQLEGGREAQLWFERNVRAANIPVLQVDLNLQEDLTPARLPRIAEGWARLATLHSAVLLITGLEQRNPEMRRDLSYVCADYLPDLVPALVLHGGSLEGATWGTGNRPIRPVAHAKLTIKTRALLWQQRAARAGLALAPDDAAVLATTARFDEAQIDAAISIAKGLAPDAAERSLPALSEAARRIARASAPEAVQLVDSTFGWRDIVLPDDVFAQLKSIPGHVRHAGVVLEDWGYAQRMPYGRGVTALFNGPSGTGKSMAAQIVAGDLGSVLYRIDLSKTVSKWLGETEKILSRIFDLAQQNSAVLFFDEADVLFAKRTEVKDAHDRYANVEVAYLLQRIEDYDGLAILTTNLKQNIDQAFMRRLRFVVDFPMPGPDDRLKIWKRAFPDPKRLAGDVDFTFLARRLPFAGGNIQQIAVQAAFEAAAEFSEGRGDAGEEPRIAMRHIVRATLQELVKLGMLSAHRTLAELAVDQDAPRKEVGA